MVLVEFFDIEPINNLIGALTINPEKVYLVGESKKVSAMSEKYNSFLKHRGKKPLFAPSPVSKNDINKIVTRLSEITEAAEECCFDLTGGDDTVLVAVGMVYEKYKNSKRILLHRYNVKNNSVSFFETGKKEDMEIIIPKMTVAEVVSLHGGSVSPVEFRDTDSGSWNFTPEFEQDIDRMWDISCRNPSRWNAVMGVLSAWENIKEISASPLDTKVKIANIGIIAKNSVNSVNTVCRLLSELEESGLVLNFEKTEECLSFSYKNRQVKRCLSKSGNVLELKTISLARKVTDKNGVPCYDDFDIQVCIDWDGKYNISGKKDTSNEIDVMLMKGLIPFFISCKNGSVDEDELYKLNTVARRFGGSYAKKVLVTTHLGKSGEALKYFRQRAEDMSVILIDNVHEMDDSAFAKALRSLPSRNY